MHVICQLTEKFSRCHHFNLTSRRQGHTGPVTSLQLHSTAGGRVLLISTAGDAEVRIWEGPQVSATSSRPCSNIDDGQATRGGERVVSSGTPTPSVGPAAASREVPAHESCQPSTAPSEVPAEAQSAPEGGQRSTGDEWHLSQVLSGGRMQLCAAVTYLPTDPDW